MGDRAGLGGPDIASCESSAKRKTNKSCKQVEIGTKGGHSGDVFHQPVGQMPTQIRFQIQDRVRPMTRQGGMKQAARDWLNRTDATGNGILNGKNESDVRTGLTSVCQLLYFPISCFFTSPNWCTLSPNSPIEKKEISNDRTRPMKADQGFYSLAKRAHYSASITEAKAMCPIDQPKSILIKE